MLKGLIVAAILLVLLTSFLVVNHVGFTYAGASPLNVGWDGTSRLVKYLKLNGFNVRVVTDWSSVKAGFPGRSSCGLIFIISPTKPLSTDEVSRISHLVRNDGYFLIVADEGVYSNKVLKDLDIPVRIVGNVILWSGSPYVPVNIRIGARAVRVVLTYASYLRVWGGAKVLGSVKGKAVVAEYRGGGVKALVIGDGTVLINDALITFNPTNPYVRLLNAVIAYACGSSKGSVLIDGEPYRLRPEGIGKLLSAGYPLSYVIAAAVNPYRYYYELQGSARYAGKLLLFITATIAVLTMVIAVRSVIKGVPKLGVRQVAGVGFRLRLDESAGLESLANACREGMLKEFSEVCNVLESGSTAVDKVLSQLSRNPRFREAVIKALARFREFKESP